MTTETNAQPEQNGFITASANKIIPEEIIACDNPERKAIIDAFVDAWALTPNPKIILTGTQNHLAILANELVHELRVQGQGETNPYIFAAQEYIPFYSRSPNCSISETNLYLRPNQFRISEVAARAIQDLEIGDSVLILIEETEESQRELLSILELLPDHCTIGVCAIHGSHAALAKLVLDYLEFIHRTFANGIVTSVLY